MACPGAPKARVLPEREGLSQLDLLELLGSIGIIGHQRLLLFFSFTAHVARRIDRAGREHQVLEEGEMGL